jgi:hypothetical protein
MPGRSIVVAVSLTPIGLGINGVRTGLVVGRIGDVMRAENPTWFWFRVVLYGVLGMLGLYYLWLRDAQLRLERTVIYKLPVN